MRIAFRSYVLVLMLVGILSSGCTPSLQTGGDIAQGRQALFRGDKQAALSKLPPVRKVE